MTSPKNLLIMLCSSSLLCADTLQLRDGRTVRGVYRGGDDREIRFRPDNDSLEQRYRLDEVTSVSFESGSDYRSDRSRGGNYEYRGGDASRSQADAYRTETDRDRRDDRYRNDTDRYRTDNDRYRNDNDRYRNDRPRTADAGDPAGPSSGTQVPAGTVVTVRTIDSIDSNRDSAGQTFRASLDDPIVVDGRTLAPAGSDVLMRVARVQQAGGIRGQEEVAVELAQITVDGRRYEVSSDYAQVASKARGSQSAKVVGGTAVVGAILGAIAGGGKGAAIGAASGAGAGVAIQAIRGQRVQIPSESRLEFRLSRPVSLN